MEQVQRLNGSWDFKKSLRYSLLLCENKGINGAWFSSPLKQKTFWSGQNIQTKYKNTPITFLYKLYKNESFTLS